MRSECEQFLCLVLLPKPLWGSVSLGSCLQAFPCWHEALIVQDWVGRGALWSSPSSQGEKRQQSVLLSVCVLSSHRRGRYPSDSTLKSINASSNLEAAWLSWASVTQCCSAQLNYLGWVGRICHTVSEDFAMLSKHISCLGCWVNLYSTHRHLWLKLTGRRQIRQGKKHYTHRRQRKDTAPMLSNQINCSGCCMKSWTILRLHSQPV